MNRWPVGVCVALAGLSAAGCNVVGPASIVNGRAAYGEVITQSNNQQLLRAIVLDRFSESSILMAVTSVTANVNLKANAGAQFGAGPSDNYSGNLVPFSLGFAYEENPTISYVPVDTPTYVRQLMSPLSLEQALLLIRGVEDKSMALCMLIDRLNGLTNPITLGAAPSDASDFERATKLIDYLAHSGASDLVSTGDGNFGILVRVKELEDLSKLEELLKLLKLTDLLTPWGELSTSGAARSNARRQKEKQQDAGADKGAGSGASDSDAGSKTGGLAEAETSVVERASRDLLVIPIRFSAAPDGSSIAMMTRSVYDLVHVASDSVEVPADQVTDGMAPPSRGAGLTSSLINIRSSASEPRNALVSTRVHGQWYYIDNNDLQSKEFFRLLTGMWSAQMAEAKTGFQAPLLTVGVSR